MVEGFFDEILDSRQDWKVLHSIEQILTVVMCGVSAGENTIHGIYIFSQIKEKWLREKVGLKLPNGNRNLREGMQGRKEERDFSLSRTLVCTMMITG